MCMWKGYIASENNIHTECSERDKCCLVQSCEYHKARNLAGSKNGLGLSLDCGHYIYARRDAMYGV